MPNKSLLPFCSDKCLKEFSRDRSPEKQFEAGPCFNLIGSVLENLFHSKHDHDRVTRERNITWLKSPVVHAWCDCSDNFNNDKLVKMYESTISSSGSSR